MTQQAQKKEEKSKTIKTQSPVTEQILNEYDIYTKEQINEATRKSRDVFVREWSTISFR